MWREGGELECKQDAITVLWSDGSWFDDVNNCTQEGWYETLGQNAICKDEDDCVLYATLVYENLKGDEKVDVSHGKRMMCIFWEEFRTYTVQSAQMWRTGLLGAITLWKFLHGWIHRDSLLAPVI